MRAIIGRIGCIVLLGLFGWSTSRADEFAPLFPFLISYDAPDNASSMAHLVDAPAGKHGFVRVEDGRFVDDRGPVRLHATNLTGPANFPTHEAADKLASRLARFGINCVRLHYMDEAYGNFMTPNRLGIIADDPGTQRNLDPGQLDRLDYLIAALKKRGIYVNINLHVARHWDERDGFVRGGPWADKGVDNFEPRMIELQKEYARKLLTRVSPYTKVAYTDDPCVAMIEINNENALFSQYHRGGIDHLPAPYAAELQRQWNAWLAKRYPTTEAVREAWQWVATPLCDEQNPEGSFDGPVTFDKERWILACGSAKATANVVDGALQVEVTQDGHEYFPKLFRALTVKEGQPYTLSFRVRRLKGEGPVTLGLAVADTDGGWRPLGLHRTLAVGNAWQKIVVPFVAGADSDRAQFQLTRFKVGTYEIDDLSFQSGAETEFNADARLEDGSIPIVRNHGYAPLKARRDFYEFLVDTERDYWTGMRDYLKNELKARSIISGTQLGYSPPHVQAELDYIDSHAYWCHPSPVSPDWRIRNLSMVNSLSCIQRLAGQRVHGMAYTVSEYNHPFPNQFGAEGQPMLRAYGRFQGWDGVFEYTYNHEPDFEPRRNTYFFSIAARTDVLAHFPACAAIYLRGDVQEAKSTVVGAMDYPTYFDRLVGSKAVGLSINNTGFDSRLTLIHKTAVDLAGEHGTDPAAVRTIPDDQKVIVSDTGELTWNMEQPGAGYWTVDTPNTKLFTGFPKGRTIALGDVTLAIGRTRLDWATVSLVSRNATGFGQSNRPASILLAATGLAENEGSVIEQVSGNEIRFQDSWGDGTVCVEGIPLVVTLPTQPERVRCFALDQRGDRKGEVPVERAVQGGSKIAIGPEYATVWYEIEVR
ncbi:MAG: cellulase family glycosylhydrolase [Thermoguttaceae bacterium]|jgi:hypothetical protein|nr:cellulase family glycosylhydrolase [Thermoguttaceae bacterium]